MRKAIEEYKMIEEGDKIAICLSGGKDSITMLHAFKSLQRFYPKKFEIIAISIDPGFEFFDTQLLQNTCDNLEIPLFIEKSNAKEIVFDIRKEKILVHYVQTCVEALLIQLPYEKDAIKLLWDIIKMMF